MISYTKNGTARARVACYGTAVSLILSISLFASEIGTSARVAIKRTPNRGEPAEAQIDAGGTIHLLFDSKSDGIPYYVKSTDGGATFSSPIPVVEREARKPGLVFSGSAMASGKGGAVYVAMMTNNWK